MDTRVLIPGTWSGGHGSLALTPREVGPDPAEIAQRVTAAYYAGGNLLLKSSHRGHAQGWRGGMDWGGKQRLRVTGNGVGRVGWHIGRRVPESSKEGTQSQIGGWGLLRGEPKVRWEDGEGSLLQGRLGLF